MSVKWGVFEVTVEYSSGNVNCGLELSRVGPY